MTILSRWHALGSKSNSKRLKKVRKNCPSRKDREIPYSDIKEAIVTVTF